MDPKQLYIDDRFRGVCSYCGAWPDNRDHVPSRVLLETPYPDNLPVVESCTECNEGFSQDEEYLACFIECVKKGTTDYDETFRPKVAKILRARPSIQRRIESSKKTGEQGEIIWKPEIDRVKNVVLKLARGHMVYELGLQHLEDPAVMDVVPAPLMTEEYISNFFSPTEYGEFLYPEIGSRSFITLWKEKHKAYGEWNVIQEGLCEYMIGQSGGDWVKFIISDYLACKVVWD